MGKTPIERAAAAVEAAIFNPTLRASISIECDDPRRVHEAIARAVIAAIREPSAAMMKPDTVFSHFFHDGDELEDNAYFEPDQMRDCWQAMIDKALEEG